MRKRFGSQKLKTKMMLWYMFFAMLPMILVTVYMYCTTRQIMLESLNERLDSQMDKISRELDRKIGDYYTISSLLYMDETLWSYLMADYSQRGYENLYAYVDSQFSDIKMLYPDINGLSVYSTNTTLPRDDYYFYVLDEQMLEEQKQKFRQEGNRLQMSRNEEGSICFTRFLNRYETGRYRIFLEISLDQSVIGQILENSDKELSVVLTDEEGVIQISNREELVGKKWEEVDLNHQVTRRSNAEFCGELILFTDAQRFERPVQQVAVRMLLVFAVSFGLAFLMIARYSMRFQKNVDGVMHGVSVISQGNFTYKIPDTGGDEIGMIAESVNSLGDKIQEIIEESYKKELDRQISEMNQLQEQINPHFLYNALSSISSMAMNNQDYETSRAIVYLADFYRISLNKGNQELTIREEIRLLESYMKIQKLRLGGAVVLEYDLDESLLDHKVMKLTLQPVVENAIHHGRTDDTESFYILIRLYRTDKGVALEVIDDGCGIPPDKMMELQDSMDQFQGGYGLRNVNIRIKLQYGEEYGVSIESEEGFGTKVRIELP